MGRDELKAGEMWNTNFVIAPAGLHQPPERDPVIARRGYPGALADHRASFPQRTSPGAHRCGILSLETASSRSSAKESAFRVRTYVDTAS